MFETTAEIRRQARIKALAKALDTRDRVVRDRIREEGIELTPEVEMKVFGRIIPPRRRFSWLPWSRG